MPRIRTVKPEFWKSETVAALTVPTRLTFIGLWNYVDDNGVGRDNAALIVAELYPLDDPHESSVRVHRALSECSVSGVITRYKVDGRAYFHVTGWTKHQRINRPSPPRYPLPDDERAEPLTCTNVRVAASFTESSVSAHGVLTEGSLPEEGAGSREQGAGRTTSPDPMKRSNKANSHTEPAGFAEWYAAYPLHKGRRAAAGAYARAVRAASPDRLLAAAERFAQDPSRDPAFTPHPATWLNQGRWDDEGPARPQLLNPAEERHRRNLALVQAFAAQDSHQPELGA